MTREGSLWLTEADVAGVLDMAGAISAVEESLVGEAAGTVHNMAKAHATWGVGHTLHATGGVLEPSAVVGTKTWAHTAGGANPLLLLFDANSGDVIAVIEAFVLGQMRTAAVSAIATRLLAADDAEELGIVGSGKQALPQVAAIVAVRPLRRVRVFSPTLEHRVAFAKTVEEVLGIEALVASSVQDALEGVAVVTLVTRATVPFVTSSMLAPGVHINAIGAIVPQRREFEPEILGQCSTVTTDSLEQAALLSWELRSWYGEGGDWSAVHPLSELIVNCDCNREGLTLLKALGVGIFDVAVGVFCYEVAVRVGMGRRLDSRRLVSPRFFPDGTAKPDAKRQA